MNAKQIVTSLLKEDYKEDNVYRPGPPTFNTTELEILSYALGDASIRTDLEAAGYSRQEMDELFKKLQKIRHVKNYRT